MTHQLRVFNRDHVLVIGGAGLDAKGRPAETLQPHTSTPGRVRFNMGGVARNIAENLARLEVPTVLLTALGDDPGGPLVRTGCAAAGIDMSHSLTVPGAQTGSFVAVLDSDGELAAAVSDYGVIAHLTPAVLTERAALFAAATLIVIDANLSAEALATIFELADRYAVPVCADPTSVPHARKLIHWLDHLYMVAPNAAETTVLCGITDPAADADAALRAAQALVGLGVEIALVTLGDQGLAYADQAHTVHLPAMRTSVVDDTGAGDALTAGVIFGLLNALPLGEAVRLGMAAAALTLHSVATVVPELTQELLYNKLTTLTR